MEDSEFALDKNKASSLDIFMGLIVEFHRSPDIQGLSIRYFTAEQSGGFWCFHINWRGIHDQG